MRSAVAKLDGMASGAALVAAALALVAAACGGGGDQHAEPGTPTNVSAASAYAQAPPAHLQRPFTGAPVQPSWFGVWRSAVTDGSDVHVLAATSPECRGLTRGRTTCWTVGPPQSSTNAADIYAGGSLTRKERKLVFRMTYNPNPNSPQCFDDDAYPYRYSSSPPRIYILFDNRPSGHGPGMHCHYERSEALANPKLRRLNAFELLLKLS